MLILNLSGCIENNNNTFKDNGLSEEEKFIGQWESEDGIIFIFNHNNYCSMEGFFQGVGKWSINNETVYITLEYEDGQNHMAFDYVFSADNTSLTLIDPSNRYRIYYKQ